MRLQPRAALRVAEGPALGYNPVIVLGRAGVEVASQRGAGEVELGERRQVSGVVPNSPVKSSRFGVPIPGLPMTPAVAVLARA